jgi:hypothetical protein
VSIIDLIDGGYDNTYEYKYFSTDTSTGRYVYGLVETGVNTRLYTSLNWDISYDTTDGKFYDIGSSNPSKWSTSASETGTMSDFPTPSNLETHYHFGSDSTFMYTFTNPYYMA